MSKKRNYKVGDKVRVKVFKKRPYGWNSLGEMDYLMGKEVKIVKTDNDKRYIGVPSNGDFCWWLTEDEVEPIINQTIVIYRKGNEVIALDKVSGKKAVAKCCPDDTFNFETGAKLAFERLLGIEQEKFLEEFEDGKLYVFRKYLHDKRNISADIWTNDCDGKIVDVTHSLKGTIGCFMIVPAWCEEIGYKK